MLSIFNLRLNNTKPVKPDYIGNDLGQTRHYPPANKEWFNSIYAYNKNSSKLLAVTDKVILKLIKAYFNLYSHKLEKKIKSRRLRMRFRRRSTNRILVSRAELKHSSEKVIVTVYVYNRQKNYYLNKSRKGLIGFLIKDYPLIINKLMSKINKLISIKKYLKNHKKHLKVIKNQISIKKYLKNHNKHLKVINNQIIHYEKELGDTRGIWNRYFAKKMFLKKGSLDIISKVREEKILLLKGFFSILPEEKKNLFFNNKFINYEKIYVKEFICKYIKYIEEDMLHIYYKQIILFNEFKFKNTYLLPLINLIEKIYNKKIVLNLVNLKYLYLNSYIFTETIVTKLRTRQNRILKVLRIFLGIFKKPPLDKLAIFNDMYNRNKKIQNPKFNLLTTNSLFNSYCHILSSSCTLFFSDGKKNKSREEDNMRMGKKEIDCKNKNENVKQKEKINNLDKILKILVPQNFRHKSVKYVTNTVLTSIKYKSASGIRLEAAGRLTKRYTAARSLFKIKYKGNIKNIDSSYKGISTVVFRGHAKSNVQFTKLKSKTRIGSFGIKGWISSN